VHKAPQKQFARLARIPRGEKTSARDDKLTSYSRPASFRRQTQLGYGGKAANIYSGAHLESAQSNRSNVVEPPAIGRQLSAISRQLPARTASAVDDDFVPPGCHRDIGPRDSGGRAGARHIFTASDPAARTVCIGK